jgi:hypothetical protein
MEKIFSVIVVIFWVLVTYHTGRGIVKGDIFVAPCLKDLGRPQTPGTSA